MNRSFVFRASTPSEAATMAAQQAIAVAQQMSVDPKSARVVSTTLVSGDQYSSIISFPDKPSAPGPREPRMLMRGPVALPPNAHLLQAPKKKLAAAPKRHKTRS